MNANGLDCLGKSGRHHPRDQMLRFNLLLMEAIGFGH
jgi:hypothetical protein